MRIAAKIVAIVRAQEEVSALHELKTRKSGGSVFIQVHIELDPAMPLAKAHAISATRWKKRSAPLFPMPK